MGLFTLTKPEILKRTPDVQLNVPEEYVAVCDRLGLNFSVRHSAELNRLMLVQFLWENDIDIYDNAHVTSYMSKIARKAGTQFFWAPLRDVDARGTSIRNSYDKAVPIEMLRKVELILSKFKGDVHTLYFAVTDYQVSNPDPFIAVGFRFQTPNDLIPFGVWDEPGYSITKTY